MNINDEQFAAEEEYYNNEDKGIQYLEKEIPLLVDNWHEMLMQTQSDILKGDHLSRRFAPSLTSWLTQFIEPDMPKIDNEESDDNEEKYTSKKNKTKCKIAYADNSSSYNTHYPKRTSNGK